MSNLFFIDGYWKNDKTEFSGYIVKENNDIIEEEDDRIFFYGLSENNLKEAIQLGENTLHDFVITSYSPFVNDESMFMCNNCGGGFKREEMTFDDDNDEDLCNSCSNEKQSI